LASPVWKAAVWSLPFPAASILSSFFT
jgi:hypothetical protein